MLAPVQIAEQGRWVIRSQETGRIRVGFLRKRDPDAGRETTTRIFHSSDLHGSDRCWRKFLGAAEFYKADTLIMGGDLLGKAVVLAEQASGPSPAIFMFHAPPDDSGLDTAREIKPDDLAYVEIPSE